jgi:Putative transposase
MATSNANCNYFMQGDAVVLNMVLRIFLRVIAQSLQAHSPGAANVDKAALHIGAVAFIHRFGSSLDEHVHFGYGITSKVRSCEATI